MPSRGPEYLGMVLRNLMGLLAGPGEVIPDVVAVIRGGGGAVARGEASRPVSMATLRCCITYKDLASVV